MCLHVSQIQIPVTDLYPSYETVIMDIVKDTEARFGKEFNRIEGENPGVQVLLQRSSGGALSTGSSRRQKADEAELIVMGKKGHGLIGSALLGSNTLKVLRNSPVPVLSVKT